jgi:SOS response regulatory protein OraA/RecX
VSVYVQEHLYALLPIIVLKCKSAKQRGLRKMIQHWVQKRRLTKQLAKAGYSKDAIQEILRLYGAKPK